MVVSERLRERREGQGEKKATQAENSSHTNGLHVRYYGSQPRQGA